ncbi:MAG TPA: hypothetical protein VGL62_15190 [Vicinamibacterales bacterium]|jgi:hypothetical protein
MARALSAIVAAIALLVLPVAARQPARGTFARTVASLSEAAGYFDTDNLISNESSYLQVIPELEKRGVRGGAYVGVGPDQNFTYIAVTRPSIAIIVDIRRDNLLLQLLFKTLFRESPTRVEYLSLLFGKQPPVDAAAWRDAGIDRIAGYIDQAKRADAAALWTRLERTIRSIGVPLSDADIQTIRRFHDNFVDAGLSLRFQSAGRAPQLRYPTFRDLLLDTDGSGARSNFLGSEERYQFVRDLENHDLVIPVVGDLAGPTAVATIGHFLASRGERVNTFYVSNVEFYLFRQDAFPRFIANVRQLPHDSHSVIVRSIFSGLYALGGARPGDDSVSQIQTIDDLLSGYAGGRIRMYADLIRAR